MKESRKIFFTILLAALLIFSNIVVVKIIHVQNLTFAASIFTYPFTFLCVLILTEIYGMKISFQSLFYSILAQLIMLTVGTIIVNIPTDPSSVLGANALQTIIAPEKVNEIYMPNIKIIITSLGAFAIAQSAAIFVYNYLRKNINKIVAFSVAVLMAIMIDSLIFIPITNIGIDNSVILPRIMNQLIVAVASAFIMSIVYMAINKKPENEIE